MDSCYALAEHLSTHTSGRTTSLYHLPSRTVIGCSLHLILSVKVPFPLNISLQLILTFLFQSSFCHGCYISEYSNMFKASHICTQVWLLLSAHLPLMGHTYLWFLVFPNPYLSPSECQSNYIV